MQESQFPENQGLNGKIGARLLLCGSWLYDFSSGLNSGYEVYCENNVFFMSGVSS